MEAQKWLYVSWFRDQSALPEDEDQEWVACFLVVARSAEEAKFWGDKLSKSKSARQPNDQFLWSEVQAPQESQYARSRDTLPVITYGEEPSDQFIGW